MLKRVHHKEKKAQTAIEYMILLGAVVAIALVGIRTFLPSFQESANLYFNRASYGIMGDPPRCGDGVCRPMPFESCQKCPDDCGFCFNHAS